MENKITSTKNNHIKDLVKLKDKKTRNELKTYLVEGYHLVEEAKKANVLIETIATTPYDFENHVIVSEEVINKLATSVTPQNMIGVCQMKKNDFESDNILILDEIKDPGNLGTLLRSALAFSYKKIYLSKNSCDIFNSKVLRSSQGAIFNLDITYTDDLISLIEELKKDYKVYATSLSGQEVTNFKKEKNVIILGNEANGVSQEIIDKCETLKIKTSEVESLNVSVAGSILMFSLSKI